MIIKLSWMTLIFTPINNHSECLQDLFRVLHKFGLKISPHKCQFYRDNLIYMGLKFIIRNNKACYTPRKDKCDAILNLSPPKSVKEVHQFCGMVNFLSSFLPKLRLLLVPIYELTKKKNLFKWMQECQQAFDIIKDLCTKLPILHMPNQTGTFQLKSDTSREGVSGTLYQLQDNNWLLIGYHSKKLPDAVRSYGVAELELTGLYVNIHGFIHILKNRYFEILVYHRAIEYMKKTKHEPNTKRLMVLLLKLQDFQFDLKYMQGTKMHVSDALSRLYTEENHKITDIIPLNFLQHTEDTCTNKTYKYCTESLYRHKNSVNKLTPNNRKKGRPPKGKNCLQDKTVKQVVKQPITTTKQAD